MVAPSFQAFEMLCEPYEVNGKQYIKVRNPRTGTERQIRFYSEAEYRKLYPDSDAKASIEEKKKDKYYRPLRDVLGFSKGYITIFGNTDHENDYFMLNKNCRYAVRWGWYVPSEKEIPDDLPDEVISYRLNYASVFLDPDTLKPEAEITKAVDALIYEPSPSQFVGTIGERIEIDVIVINSVRLENQYGISTLHVFEDAQKNQYIWATSAKSWAIGTAHHIRGTIREHRAFRGANQTVLTRCLEV